MEQCDQEAFVIQNLAHVLNECLPRRRRLPLCGFIYCVIYCVTLLREALVYFYCVTLLREALVYF